MSVWIIVSLIWAGVVIVLVAFFIGATRDSDLKSYQKWQERRRDDE